MIDSMSFTMVLDGIKHWYSMIWKIMGAFEHTTYGSQESRLGF